MDFLNKLGKKASETYQATKEKASTISEELKLKSKINSLEEKIFEIYAEVGEIVYNEMKDGKDVSKEEIAIKCEDISRKKDEISKLQTELLTVKKIKKCVNCGVELEIESEFCSKCGTKQPVIEKVEIKKEEPTEVKEAELIEVNNVPQEAENSSNESSNEGSKESSDNDQDK